MNQYSGTRESLLQAGRRLFAERGYEGASVRSIAAMAGTNLGSVTYHFGSKQQLHDAVMAQIWDPLAEQLTRQQARTGSALERIEAIVRIMFNHFAATPETVPLVLRQISPRGPLPPDARLGMKKIFGVIQSLVSAGQSDGTVAAGDPAVLTLAVMALPLHVLSLRFRAEDAEAHAYVPARVKPVVEDAVGFVRRGLSRSRTR